MKKHSKLTVCLVAGVLVLSVSAFAAFSSVSGYARYKDAVKALAMDADNYTAKVSMQVSVDGAQLADATVDYLRNGGDVSIHSKDTSENQENWDSTINGTNIRFSSDDTENYYKYTDATSARSLTGDDEMDKRVVNFMEIVADTVVGDLKNNFVQTGSDANGDTYTVDIDKSQVPSIINAGLSLMAYSVNEGNSNGYWVNFEDYEGSLAAYYEKTTGQALPEGFLETYRGDWTDEWDTANEALIEQLSDLSDEMTAPYEATLKEKDGGVMYVHADGTYDYYAGEAAFYAAHPEKGPYEAQLEAMIGEDAALEHVTCVFTVDKNGNLTANKMDVTFSSTGSDGKTHTMVVTLDATISNYGTTQVTPFDVGARTEYGAEAAE